VLDGGDVGGRRLDVASATGGLVGGGDAWSGERKAGGDGEEGGRAAEDGERRHALLVGCPAPGGTPVGHFWTFV
jgi:hypothetical protein